MSGFLVVAGDIISTGIVVAALVYAGYRSVRRSDDPAWLICKWVITVLVIGCGLFMLHGFSQQFWPVVVLPFAVVVGLLWTPSIATMFARPLTSAFDGGNQEVEAAPLYSMAEAKRQRGMYSEAIQAAQEQLGKYPGDFRGIFLIASIQAENLKDLAGAQETLETVLQTPNIPPSQTVTSLNALADWHLQYAQDPDAARGFFERIVQSFPDTPFSNHAAQRIARLGTKEQMAAAHEHGKITLRPGERDLGLRGEVRPAPAEQDPAELAREYLAQLQAHPLDVDTREKLATLYAERFDRLDLAEDQLEQLIAQPNEPPKHAAHWLDLMATLRIRHGNNGPGAEAALRRIEELFPGTALAQTAERRRISLGQEVKAKTGAGVKKLGTYEKDIGLKKASG